MKIKTFLGPEMASHVHKITNVPVLMILMGANPLLRPLEKSGSTPSSGPCNGFVRIKIIKSLRPAPYKDIYYLLIYLKVDDDLALAS
jgi:hypothetical protein